jgi:hypothetical protein
LIHGLYRKIGLLPNPFNFAFNRVLVHRVQDEDVMVGCLAPTHIARRLVDDALETEQAGLNGIF